jgi:hypothetical protein
MAAFAEALEHFQVTQQIPMGIGTGVSTALGTGQVRATDVAAAALGSVGNVSIAGDATGLQKGTDLGTVSGGVSLLNRSLDGRNALATGEVGLPQKSKLPMIGAGVGVMALAAVGAFFAFSPAKATTVPNPPVVERRPNPPPVAPPVVDPPTGATVPLADALTAIQLESSRNAFGNGTTEFKNGNLESARNYFTGVPAGAPDHEAAQTQVKIIDEAIKTTGQAHGLKARGKCADAIPLFRAALKLNSKYKDAAGGLAGCENAVIPARMD